MTTTTLTCAACGHPVDSPLGCPNCGWREDAKKQVHCFEKAGLGLAPFRYVGMEDQDIRHGQRVIGTVGGVEVTTKPGGTCAYCGTYIVNMFNIESADGNQFHVGCECVKKTGDAGLIRKVEADVKKHDRKKREDRKAAKIAAAKEYCLTACKFNMGTLCSIPHPSPTLAGLGKNAGDYANWMIEMRHFETLAAYLKSVLNK